MRVHECACVCRVTAYRSRGWMAGCTVSSSAVVAVVSSVCMRVGVPHDAQRVCTVLAEGAGAQLQYVSIKEARDTP
jgi:hypothetical protein